MNIQDINSEKRASVKTLKIIVFIVSIATSLLHIFFSISTSISVMQQRVLHLFLLIILWYLYQILKAVNVSKLKVIISFILCVTTIVTGIFFLNGSIPNNLLQKGIFGPGKIDIFFGVILVLLVLEITRKAIGWPLLVIAAIFVAYTLFGPYMPEVIAHKGYNVRYLTNYLTWTLEGIFGTPIGASVTFVSLYIIFGELLDKFGAGKFFINLAYAMTGRMKGGPAEASVISSAFMGSINGSAVANVVTTGTFTIPLMKKVGYKSHFAAAVEAVASTGGQILPPVMGAAAFIMADMTGIEYSHIILAALLPGILYYLCLGICVYLEADKLGIEGESKDKLPQIKKVLKEGYYHLIPIIVLIYALVVEKLSASYSAIFAIVALLIIGTIKSLIQEKKLPIKPVVEALFKAAKTTIPVAAACAAAGIVIGVVSMTGIGVKFTKIVLDLSGGNMFLMLAMIMLACIVLGMGLPSTAAYVIAAAVGVPPLVQAGVPLLAANMFVFYFAVISFITPPVALAAYAGAGIADANAMKTGFQAFFLGLAGFIIPYAYVYNPALLIVGSSFGSVLQITLIAVSAIIMLAVAVEGWISGKVNLIFRLSLGALAIGTLNTNLIISLACVAIGLTLVVVILLTNSKKQKLA